jgi:hypothetical protein
MPVTTARPPGRSTAYLGGLKHQGTTFEAGIAALNQLYGSQIEGRTVNDAPIDELIVWANRRVGVVVRLSNGPGVEGHAVRLDAGDGMTRPETDDELFLSIMRASDREMADLFEHQVWVFDPDPRSPMLSRLAVQSLRDRYVFGGSRAAIVIPRRARATRGA